MRLVLLILIGFGLLVLAVLLVGLALPKQHRATRERLVAASPDAVFRVITTPAEFPTWRARVREVELLADEAGKPRFREHGRDGVITYVLEEAIPSKRVVSRIDDPSLPFGGTWTFELTPADGGTLLRITEDGEVSNPLFRFMSRFVFGHHAGIETYLADLGRHLAPVASLP
ncbi:MAG: SRPBCC domain-containing protein [Gemmatimonadales bacterium]|nr:SRPBCC domain-containing protein [Gemmatimonadales bacterium]